MLFTGADTELGVEAFCPKCGSEDVVVKIGDFNLFVIQRCNKCNFIRNNNR